MHHFGHCELMQYIGHYDKTCVKKIFEGDIVIWQGEGLTGDFYHRCEVIFDEIEWNGWSLKNLDDHDLRPVPIGIHGARYEELEVIGHKYDKSYLLRDNPDYRLN